MSRASEAGRLMARRYRAYTTGACERVCDRHAEDARAVWHAALEQLNHWRPGRSGSPGYAERNRQLAETRKELDWLAAGSSSVQQQALRDFQQACKNWRAGTHRRPTWRTRRINDGFCVRDVTVRKLNRRWAQITIPKAGPVRFRLSRPSVALSTRAQNDGPALGLEAIQFDTQFQLAFSGAPASVLGIVRFGTGERDGVGCSC